MADYKILAVGLTTPPTPAYVTQYRPAVAVQNLGTQPVSLTGTFRVYERVAPGRLLFSCNLYLTTLPAGTTKDALGDDYWTPPAAGSYTVQAHIDGGRPNLWSDFGPYLLPVSSSPPPPPPVVTPHAVQHEQSGSDELNVDDLAGELRDDQPPKDHAGKHEQGGADELSVTGLHGSLADPQPTAPHWNDKHTVAGASLVDLAAHTSATSAHASATNLEQTAHKDQANGYPGLDGSGLVAADKLAPAPPVDSYLRSDRTWQPGTTAAHGNELHTAEYATADPPSVPTAQDTPMVLGNMGNLATVARADHRHQSPGGFGRLPYFTALPNGAWRDAARGAVPGELIVDFAHFTLLGFGVISFSNIGVSALFFRIGTSSSPGLMEEIFIGGYVLIPSTADNQPWVVRGHIHRTSPTPTYMAVTAEVLSPLDPPSRCDSNLFSASFDPFITSNRQLALQVMVESCQPPSEIRGGLITHDLMSVPFGL